MIVRSLLLASALLFSASAFAEEQVKEVENNEQAPAPLTYCQQLGKATGFTEGDLEEFIGECEENRNPKTASAGQ